ncbi:MAG: ABC transporter ATP-binding protein [Oscillospiraceae bacterium]|jgi:ABC-2 type transport system ATP-binding protein|nr:ABC transporter ATP-binding protein [Oscillospiraceae bacterium]
MILSMNEVVKRYRALIALDHLTVNLQKGEALGLLGPNGAGKTTAIRVLTGLTGADAGEIRLFGKELRGKSNSIAIRQRIGLVPQDLALYETLSARDNLEYFGKLYGVYGAELKKRVDEALEILGLSDVAKKSPKKFSGGMKRRLNIGCAVIHKPELLILDEPTVGIDPQSRNHILDFVSEINKQGTTVLYTSHYMEEVERVCSRVCIMDAGRVIADGSVDDIAKSAIFEETIILEVKEPAPSLPENIKKIQGVVRCDTLNRTVTITSTAGSGNLSRIIEVASPYVILGVTAKRATLEDAFLALTGKSLRDGGEAS